MSIELTPFQEAVRDQIVSLGDQNHEVDPFKPGDTKASGHEYYKIGNDGFIKYGGAWDSHRAGFGTVAVQYAFRESTEPGSRACSPHRSIRPAIAEFVIYRFGEQGLDTRIRYGEGLSLTPGLIREVARDFEIMGPIWPGISVLRVLGEIEKPELVAIIKSPTEEKLVRLSVVTKGESESLEREKATYLQGEEEQARLLKEIANCAVWPQPGRSLR